MICLQFAREVKDYQKMKRLGWSNTAFERKNKVVVAVAKRFE